MGYTHYWKKSESTTEEFNQWAILTLKAAVLSAVPFEASMGDDYLMLNGVGDDACEDFYMTIKQTSFDFCKTRQAQYDVIVAASLIIAAEVFGTGIEIASDGDEDDIWWAYAIRLARLTLDHPVSYPCVEALSK